MKKFKVIGISVTFNPGSILSLDKKQAARRALFVKDLGKGLYLVEKAVQFKHDETLGYDGDINKALLTDLAEEGSAVASAPELIKLIKGAKDLETLGDLPENEKRKTVVAAFESRKAELEAEAMLIAISLCETIEVLDTLSGDGSHHQTVCDAFIDRAKELKE